MLFAKSSSGVQEAALTNPASGIKPLGLPKPPVTKLYLVGGALLFASFLVWGIFQATGGDMTVLRQRVSGEVKLSTGTYSARTLHELNELSWDNGLQVLETLDTLNDNIQALQQTQASPALANTNGIQAKIRDARRHIDELLADQKVLVRTAGIFKTRNLYTPEYQEYLSDTMAKLSSLNVAQTATPSTHEVQ